MNPEGTAGIVLIAFLGSVFSPYYAWSRALSGSPGPDNFVCINIALYTPGRKHWCMTERGRTSLSRTTTTFAVGPSALRWTGDTLLIDIDEVTVPIPRRVRGRIALTPKALTAAPFALDAGGKHAWWPLAPRADVQVQLQEPAWSWRGDGYFDRNWGAEPLEDAFASWTWSRTPFGAQTLLLYDAAPRHGEAHSLALAVDRHGTVVHVPPPAPAALSRTRWRLPRSTRSQGDARIVRGLEDAPFYARASIETSWQGQRGIGMHEVLSLDRFRSRIVQAMLAFRMPRRGRSTRQQP